MVIGDLLETAANRLDNGETGDSYIEALVLLTFALNCNKTYIYVHRDKEVDENIASIYLEYIERKAKGEPVSYITGSAWFMSFEFIVNPSVLIPRPETEGLVEKAEQLIETEFTEKVRILDMCTGSGCIGISLAEMFTQAEVHLADIDKDALEVAEQNIKKHSLEDRVHAIQSDLFENVSKIKYDIILSNPPYVAEDDILHLEDNVRKYEPEKALFGGPDGLYFYKKIAQQAGAYLNHGGYLILEAGIGQSDAISALLVENKFTVIDIQNDIAGIPRVITSKK